MVLCILKNGAEHIQSFVEHYTRLGLNNFVFLDNGSSDQTIECLRKQIGGNKRLFILQCLLPFRHFQFWMRRYLYWFYGENKWCFVSDIDERFLGPWEKSQIYCMLDYLEAYRFTSVTSQMLDLFPKNAVGFKDPERNLRPKEDHAFYDLTAISKENDTEGFQGRGIDFIKVHRGGIRQKVFGLHRVNLTKSCPVYFKRNTNFFIHPHKISNLRPADFTGLLMHFKFTSGFHRQVKEAVIQKNYFKDSAEYFAYHKTLEEQGSVVFYSNSSRKFEGYHSLVEQGFLVEGEGCRYWRTKGMTKKLKIAILTKASGYGKRRNRFLSQVVGQHYPNWVLGIYQESDSLRFWKSKNQKAVEDERIHWVRPGKQEAGNRLPRFFTAQVLLKEYPDIDYFVFWKDENQFFPYSLMEIVSNLYRSGLPDVLVIPIMRGIEFFLPREPVAVETDQLVVKKDTFLKFYPAKEENLYSEPDTEFFHQMVLQGIEMKRSGYEPISRRNESMTESLARWEKTFLKSFN